MAVPGITLVFKRSAAQENALQELLTAQQNTASQLYHHWLTPDDFAARFGMADKDIATAETWLRSRGFHIENESRGRDRITFSGDAAQVQAAFGTGLHYYQTDGELHFAPEADLSLPTELASVTAAVLHLSNFRPKPSYSPVHPNFTTPSTQTHYLAPKDIFTMYNLSALYQSGTLGAGQKLAVVGQSFVDTSISSKVDQFQTYLAQPNTINAVLVPGSGVQAISPGDEGESEIDLEYASGIAQNARIFLVYVGANRNYDVFDSLEFAIEQNIAPVISISYGICESLLSATQLDAGNALFEQAAAQGQTLIAAAGDSGSTACAVYSSSNGVPLAQQQALSVSYPADSPYVTAVGGTQMAAGAFEAGPNSNWASANNSGVDSSLLAYVPEVVWNEGSVSHGIVAGGGGVSAHYPRPAWQSGAPGIPSGAYRLLPDIALQSSIASPGFLVCSDDATLAHSQGQTLSCTNGVTGNNNQYTVAGGTSFAAPIFAGLVAILNQVQHATGQGNINPFLYRLAADPTSYAAVFHDITIGTIACVAGAGTCASPGESGYAATPGYDEATGLGSVDFGHLIAAWPSSDAMNLAATNVLIIPSDTVAQPGATVPVKIQVGAFSVSGGTAAPTGTVIVSLDGTIVQPALAFSSTNTLQSSASVDYSFVAPATAGSHLLTVAYPGDAKYAPSTATYSVLVGQVKAAGGFSLAVGNLTIANGSEGSTQITLTPTGGYTGRVVWSLSSSSNASGLSACYRIGSPIVNGTSTTTLTIGVGSVCNAPSPAERKAIEPSGVRASDKEKNRFPWHGAPAMGVYAGLLFCSSLMRRKRATRLPRLFVITLLMVVGVGLNGCGGGGSSSAGNSNGTPPTSPNNTTNYTLTLTGTDSVNTAIKASTTFTLTVK
jgi:subtilase family serine protease